MEIIRPESRQPLPPHAKRVFKGDIFDVYQWEQELFDGSTKTFDKVKRDDTIVVIPTLPGKKLLFLKDEQPARSAIHTFPAGRMDKEGEGPLEAAQRELKEETGYESDEWTLWKAYQPVTKIDWAVYVFIARNCVRTTEPALDPGERITVKEVTLDDVIALVDDPDFLSEDMKAELIAAKYDKASREVLETTIFG
ncbi:MAG TPA: NUDIX hydrolase [Candidatus Paceibacterota bacterium]|nr:NUDIX hydrolase [Candidatus Paceibacterota bacterium]